MELVKASDYGLEETKVKGIEEAFAPKIAERNELNKIYIELIKEELTPELSKKAGDLRRKLVKVRTGISSIHKTQKAFFLASGKFVDAWKNKETEPVEQMELKLAEIEKYAENLEKERLAKLQSERIELVKVYVEEIDYRNYSIMEQDVFDAYLSSKKQSYEDMIKLEKEVEEKRLAEAEAEKQRQISIEKENKKLKEEAEAKEKQLKIERLDREKVDSERLAKEKRERELKEKSDRAEKAKQEQILINEREAKERIEKELKEAKDKAAKIESDKLEAIQLELTKGDSEKVKDLISNLVILKSKYSFKSKKHQKMYNHVQQLIDKVVSHIDI